MTPLASQFDFILDTVSASHDLNAYLGLLKLNGGNGHRRCSGRCGRYSGFSLIPNNRILAGSGIGGIPETQEMLDYCAEKGIFSDVEVITMDQVPEAYERTIKIRRALPFCDRYAASKTNGHSSQRPQMLMP